VELETGVEQGLDGSDEWSAVTFDGAFKFEAFAARHDRHAVAADVAADDDGVAGPDVGGRDGIDQSAGRTNSPKVFWVPSPPLR
jgi:hypothetical protein